jgi:hypothetical protein
MRPAAGYYSQEEEVMKEEFWTKRDGTKIAVGDMEVEHLRNTLRMIIRNNRHRVVEVIAKEENLPPYAIEDQYWYWEAERDARAYRAMADPNVFFPMIDGGVYGSPELQRTRGHRCFED